MIWSLVYLGIFPHFSPLSYMSLYFYYFFFLAISAFEVQPLSTEVQEGGVARFTCKIAANPPAVVTWEVNRTTLPLSMDRYVDLHISG